MTKYILLAAVMVSGGVQGAGEAIRLMCAHLVAIKRPHAGAMKIGLEAHLQCEESRKRWDMDKMMQAVGDLPHWRAQCP